MIFFFFFNPKVLFQYMEVGRTVEGVVGTGGCEGNKSAGPAINIPGKFGYPGRFLGNWVLGFPRLMPGCCNSGGPEPASFWPQLQFLLCSLGLDGGGRVLRVSWFNFLPYFQQPSSFQSSRGNHSSKENCFIKSFRDGIQRMSSDI